MQAMVMPLGQLAPDQFGLFWQVTDGRIGLKVGTSWSDAAQRAKDELSGFEVVCDPALATVGRRFNWASQEPTPEQYLERAAVALGLAHELSPSFHDHTLAFLRAWLDFFPLRFWEQFPAEMSLRTFLRRGDKVEEGCVSVLGQHGQEFGLAWYEDWRAFDAIWSGEPFPINGFSVLAEPDPFLAPAFEPFGVPPVLLSKIVKMKPVKPTQETYLLATAALELMLDVLRPEGPQIRSAGEGLTLELKRGPHDDEAPKKKKSKPAAKQPKKTKKSKRS
jgi:hypothetical protein